MGIDIRQLDILGTKYFCGYYQPPLKSAAATGFNYVAILH